MLLSFIFACDVPKNTESSSTEKTQEVSVLQTNSTTQAQSIGDISNISIDKNDQSNSNTVHITLPSLQATTNQDKYCFVQSMPSDILGMTKLSFQADSSVGFIRVRGVQQAKTVNQWYKCAEEDPLLEQSVFEVSGVDLHSAEKGLFQGFSWFSLPDKSAFEFPGAPYWFFEVSVTQASSNIAIQTNVDTISSDSVEKWVGILDIMMDGSSVGNSKNTTSCKIGTDVTLLSVFGHAQPMVGSWKLRCNEKDIVEIDSADFAKDIPPLHNFAEPFLLAAGSTCSLECDWKEAKGEICLATLVVSPLQHSIVCRDGDAQ